MCREPRSLHAHWLVIQCLWCPLLSWAQVSWLCRSTSGVLDSSWLTQCYPCPPPPLTQESPSSSCCLLYGSLHVFPSSAEWNLSGERYGRILSQDFGVMSTCLVYRHTTQSLWPSFLYVLSLSWWLDKWKLWIFFSQMRFTHSDVGLRASIVNALCT